MPILLSPKTYRWLQSINIFPNETPKLSSSQLCEVPYNEEIYLQNGYLIGVALRKFVKPYSEQYQELLRVRKIATLRSSENWRIIEPFLSGIGCMLQGVDGDQAEIQISTGAIAEILESLYEEYSPKEEEKVRLVRRARNNFIDIYNFDSHRPLNEAENSLEFMCIVLARNLKITLGEALGLLMDKAKYLKKLIVEGSKRDEFESIISLYEDITAVWPILQQLLTPQSRDQDKILQALAEGVLSQNKDIIHLTLNLLSFITDLQWFTKFGYYKLLTSSYIECFNFTIEKLSPHYNRILNSDLHTRIADKVTLFTILSNLIKTVPKTIYAKEIFSHLPILYYYQQCYNVLNVQEIDQQPPKVVARAKELLARLMTTFVDKVPGTYVLRILETFKYNGNRGYGENYHNLVLLFEILEAFMLRESPLLERFFKVCMKYLASTFGETRHWIIDNLRYLYAKMGKSFPLGCLLAMYSLDPVAQADQYSLFLLIAQDQSSLSPEQCAYTISYLISYIESQLHCKCFLSILKLFLANNPKASLESIQQICTKLLTKMSHINIPMLNQGEINILNPKPPIRNKVINSIGIKRKEMLKFGEYELGKNLLELLGEVRDREFLGFYVNALGHSIVGIEKEIGHKKKELVNLLKLLRKKAKKALEITHEPQPMSQIVKSILVNRSALSNPISHHQYTPLSQSKFLGSESILSQHDPSPDSYTNAKLAANSIIKEQQEEESEENEFIPDFGAVRLEQAYDDVEEIARDGIMDWTDRDGNRDDGQVQLCLPAVMEQNEIAYLNIIKEKYSVLIGQCTEIYKTCIRNHKQIELWLANFRSQLGLSHLLTLSQAEQLILKCKSISSSPLELIQNFLIQAAFLIFAFKQNRRIAVTCVSSFFTIVQENIQKGQQIGLERQLSGKSPGKGALLTRNIVFQSKIDRKLGQAVGKIQAKKNRNKGKMEPFLVCFEVLNDIIQHGLNLNLIQPYSKQVNQFASPSKASPRPIPEDHQTSLDLPVSQKAPQSQLQQLQHLLDQLDEPSPQPEYRIKKSTKKQIKTMAVKQQQPKSLIFSKPNDNKELRNKLAKRLKILNEDLVKNGKNLGNLVKQELESQPQGMQLKPE